MRGTGGTQRFGAVPGRRCGVVTGPDSGKDAVNGESGSIVVKVIFPVDVCQQYFQRRIPGCFGEGILFFTESRPVTHCNVICATLMIKYPQFTEKYVKKRIIIRFSECRMNEKLE